MSFGFGGTTKKPLADVRKILAKGMQHFNKNGIYGKNIVLSLVDHGIMTGFGYVPKATYSMYAEGTGLGIHGTHSAGTFYSICAKPELHTYDLSGTNLGMGNNKKNTFADAFELIYAKAKADKRPFIVSMSLANVYDQKEHDLLNMLAEINVPVIAAAGNENNDKLLYPASYPEAVSVSAIDEYGYRAGFSSFNNEVDFCNLGIGVESIYLNNGVVTKAKVDGTSYATPLTSAQIALLADAYYEKYKERMKKSELVALAKSLCIDLGDKGVDKYYGNGLIDLSKYNFTNVTIPVPEVPKQEEQEEQEKVRNLRLTDPYMRGDDVKALQERLFLWGLLPEKEIDGVFGPKTEAAVKAFQKEMRLTADGIAGAKTQAALGMEPDAPEEPVSDFILDLVTFVLCKIGFLYVWGADGQTAITEDWIKSRDTSTSNAKRSITYWKKLQKQGLTNIEAYDCSGLISRYLEIHGKITSKRNCNHLWGLCKEIKRQDLRLGDLVFRGDPKDFYHVGVYVGNGRVVEAKGRDDGVVLRGIDTDGAEHWHYFGRLNI